MLKNIEKSSKLLCAFCQGKGVQPGAERLSCIVCGGSGRVTARQPYNVCKECGGRGKKAGATLYCFPCHGKGFVEESRYPPRAKSPVSKTRRKSVKRRKSKVVKRRARKSIRKKGGKKSAKPKVRKAPTRIAGRGFLISQSKIGTKAVVKKEKKSFFKKFLNTLKIL